MDVLFIVVGVLLLMVLISTYFALAHYEAHKAAINSDVVAEPELITEAVPPDITGEDAWQQVVLLEDQVHDLTTRMDDLRVKDGRYVTEICNTLLKCMYEHDDRIKNLDAQLGFHVERISDDIFVEDIDVYDWIAARDPEFANRCKVSYRYTPTGKIKKDYGPRKDR